MGAAFAFVAGDADHLKVAGVVAAAIRERDDVVNAELGPRRRVREDSVTGADLAIAGDVSVDRFLPQPAISAVIAASSCTSPKPLARPLVLRTARSIAELAANQAGPERPRHESALPTNAGSVSDWRTYVS